MPWTPKIGFGNDLKCSFVSLYISEFIAITYLPRSFALPAFSRTEHENKMFANVHRTTLTFTKKKTWDHKLFEKFQIRQVLVLEILIEMGGGWAMYNKLPCNMSAKLHPDRIFEVQNRYTICKCKIYWKKSPSKMFSSVATISCNGGLVDDLGLRSKSPRKQSQQWGAVHIHLSAHRQHTRTRRQVDPRLL